MATKTLTAKVRLETSDVESKIKRLNKLINNVNKAVNKTNASNLQKQLSKAGTQANKLRTKIGQVNSALSKTTTTANRVRTALNNAGTRLSRIRTQTQQWANAQRSVNNSLRSSHHILGSIGTRLRTLIGTYLGLQTIKIGITASDTVTSAQNRLNNLDGGNPKQTAEAMDKIYAASQRARTGYDTMLSNVSKTMTLAPDAFQGNIDNAIRFQEIMSKSYTVGGASAAEASTSMYQLVQALGSGVLQGDELRSVREGAPIAYKEIEKFAQKIYDTTDSLKDMASEGMITSDMVVAAIMNAGDDIEKKFNNTKVTFAQAWSQIKNMVMKSLEPTLERLNKLLNSEKGKKAINGIASALVALANVLGSIVFTFGLFFNWCVENWEWLKYVILGALIVIGVYLLWMSRIAIMTALSNVWAFLQTYWALILIVAGVMWVLYVYELWRQGTITTTEAIAYCLIGLGVIFLIVAAIMTSGIYLIIAAIILAIAAVILWFSEVCYGAGWLAGVIVNILSFLWNVILWLIQALVGCIVWLAVAILDIIIGLINAIIGIVNFLLGSILWFLAMFYNSFVGVVNAVIQLVWSSADPIIGIVEWILNACNGGFNSFGGAVANLIGQIISWFLSLGKVVTKIIDAIFGTDWTGGLNSLQDKVLGWGKKDGESITIDRTAPELKRIDATNAFSDGFNAINYLDMINPKSAARVAEHSLDGLHTNYVNPDEWANIAGNWGQGIEDAVNKWGSKFQDPNKKLGLNDSLPNPYDPKYAVDGAYNPSGLMDKLGDIKDDTGKMKDAMQLENEDLEYMRKIAEMEWKNEFTTAEIKVDMTNNNTVNGERDLDGIVEYLSDVLREEMTSVAYGVHY